MPRFHFSLPKLLAIAPQLRLADESPEDIWVECQSVERWIELAQTLNDWGLAVVGTREELPQSRVFCREVINALSVERRLIVVSGLARGVDQTAHEAALESGLPTIAIVAGGLERSYPPNAESLRRRIVETGGAVLTESHPEKPALPHEFLRRNRLIAGWSKATWVVQAPARSGALNTAAWAKFWERPLLATSAVPGSVSFAGNLRLLSSGDAVGVYGPDSFGWVWIEFAAMRYKEVRQAAFRFGVSSKATCPGLQRLIKIIENFPVGAGFMELAEIYDSEAPPSEPSFFEVLSEGVRLGFLEERGPLILKNRLSCS